MFNTNEQGLRRSPRRKSMPINDQSNPISGWSTAATARRKTVNMAPSAVPERIPFGRGIGDNNTISFGNRPIIFEGDTTMTGGLSRSNSSRASLVPSRGILKQKNSHEDHTVIGVMRTSSNLSVDDGNTTEFKKRRVSFAPKATTYQWNLSQAEATPPQEPGPDLASENKSPKKITSPRKPTKKNSPSKAAKTLTFMSPSLRQNGPEHLIMDDESNSDMQMDDVSTIFGIRSPSRNVPSQINLFSRNSPLPGRRSLTDDNDILINLDSPIRADNEAKPKQSSLLPQIQPLQPLKNASGSNRDTRVSSVDDEDDMELTSVFKGPRFKENQSPRPLKLNHQSDVDNNMEMTTVMGGSYTATEEYTNNQMDLTQNFGRIQQENYPEDNTMELTKSFGAIRQRLPNRRFTSSNGMEMTAVVGQGLTDVNKDTNDFEDEMNVTKPFGGLQELNNNKSKIGMNSNISSDDESFVMDMTRAVGGVINKENSMNFTRADVSMEITRAVGGLRNSHQSNTEKDQSLFIDATRVVGGIQPKLTIDREEETMDITRAVGGVRPRSHQEQDEDEEAMDITRAVGGVRPSNKQVQDEDEDGMDMTKAIGGLRTSSHQEQYEHEETMDITRAVGGVRSNGRQKQDEDEEAIMDVTKVVGGIRKPSSEPANTSQSLDRHNVNQKMKDSTAFHPSDEMEITKPVGSILQESFRLSKPLSPWQNRLNKIPTIPTTPMKILKDRIISMSPEKPKPRIPVFLNEKNYEILPGKLLPSTDIIGNNNVSLNEFLSMISIDFMDKFLSNSRGHSSFGISDTPVEEATDEDYIIAAQKLPLLNMYDFGARELKNDIKNAKEYFTQWEESVLEDNPVLFQEYVDASADTKQIMKSQFLLLKNFSRQQAKGAWYDWRGQLTAGLNKDLEKNKNLLDDDLKLLSKKREEAEKLNQDAQKRHEEMTKSIEQVKKRNSDLTNCDREKLADLRRRVEEIKGRIGQVRERVELSNKQKESLQSGIEKARLEKQQIHEQIQESEHIHKINRIIDNREITLLHNNYKYLCRYLGVLDCVSKENHFEIHSENGLTIIVNTIDGSISTQCTTSSSILAFFQKHLQRDIERQQEENTPTKSIITNANEMWNNCVAIQRAIELLELQFMTSVTIPEESEELDISIDLLLEDRQKGRRKPCKLTLKIRLAAKSMLSYPRGYGTATIGVVFGNSGGSTVLEQIHEGIVSALESKGLDGLSQVCLQILEDFNS